MTKGELALIHLNSIFGNNGFTFGEAKDALAKVDFVFYKQTWNSLLKKKSIFMNGDKAFLFNNDLNESQSNWLNSHRKFFICKENLDKKGYGDFFDKDDLKTIDSIYFNWKQMGQIFNEYGCRRINLPELISEGLPSVLFNWARTNNLPLSNIDNSADLVDPISGNAIQIKGISTISDEDGGPTSFGPETTFDRLIVIHVKLNEDKAYFYEMDAKNYKQWKVNGTSSIKEQQQAKRRPRLTLLPLIKEQGLAPFFIYKFGSLGDKNDKND